jgi:hypothetical protein
MNRMHAQSFRGTILSGPRLLETPVRPRQTQTGVIWSHFARAGKGSMGTSSCSKEVGEYSVNNVSPIELL